MTTKTSAEDVSLYQIYTPSTGSSFGAIDSEEAAESVFELIERSKVASLVTDTVLGLGAGFEDEEAIKKIFEIKRRPSDKTLAVLIPSISSVTSLLHEDDLETLFRIEDAIWPGPLTVIVSCHEYFARHLGGDGSSVGLRIPNDSLLRRLLEITGPLATTSANISGLPSLTAMPEFIEQLGLEPWPKSHRALAELGISVMVGGGAPSGKSSTVVDFRGDTPVIMRQGEIELFRILEALGKDD